MRQVIQIFIGVFISFLATDVKSQRFSAKQMKRAEYRKSIAVSRYSLSGGGAINPNGGGVLVGLEYIANHHVTIDVTAFYRLENYNALDFTRTGIMAGLKNSIMGYYNKHSYLNLGAGVSLMNQQAVDFESTRSIDPLTTGLYLSAEGFYALGPKWKLVARFDQQFYFTERINDNEILSLYHIGLMLRYKLSI